MGEVYYIHMSDLFARRWAERYGEIARRCVAEGDSEAAYYYAMLAAHKAAFLSAD